ncbi:MAG: hypothetical protein ABIJ56_07475 [Pseudomonadota bacterium]
MNYPVPILVLLLQACSLSTSGLGTIGADTIPPDDTADFSAELDVLDDSEDVLVDLPDPDMPIDLPVDLPPDTPPDEIIPDSPADTACLPGATWCAGLETLEICNADGMGTALETCRYYCLDGPPAHCAVPVPSNVNDAGLYCVPGTEGLNLPARTSIIFVDTDEGELSCYDESGYHIGEATGFSFTQRTQPDGAPGLGVFSFDSFTLPGGVELWAVGGHAFVILSCHDVTINGLLDAGAHGYTMDGVPYFKAGPGGSSAGDGLGAGGPGSEGGGSDEDGGGGGGGFGAIGGNGNSSVVGMAGGVYGSEELVPLLGGSGGGKGADDSYGRGGSGGAGGGALEISTPATITVNGTVSSAGYGGWGGGDAAAGGGGGSGGGILLEAHTINIPAGAIVAANGGGGGGGSYWTGSDAVSYDGEKGHDGLTPAAGGSVIAGRYGCRGGNGNSADVVNGETAACGSGEVNGGGGGGGSGRIRINSKIDSILGNPLSPSLAAPATTTTLGYPKTE